MRRRTRRHGATGPTTPDRSARCPGARRALATVGLILTGACTALSGGDGDAFGDRSLSLTGPEVRIGAVDDPDYAFGTVADLTVGPDGTVYSLHRGDAHVRLWTSRGEPAGVIGGEGEGPGEFTRPARLGFFGDSLWVMDTRTYQVSYFDPSGAFLGRVAPQVAMGRGEDVEWSPPRPEAPLRDGTFLGRAPGWSREIATGDLTRAPFVHMDGEGETLSLVWMQQLRPTDVLALMDEDGDIFGRQPFGDQTLTSTVDDGLIVVDRRAWEGEGQASVRVTRLGVAGDTVWSTAIPYEPTALPRERVDSAAKELAAVLFEFRSRADPGLAPGAFERDMIQATYAPGWVPPVRSMVVADDGSIWLERFGPVTEDDGSILRAWWILGADGVPDASAHTPDGLQVMVVTDDAVWGVETDELDVNYIVRYDLVDGSAT